MLKLAEIRRKKKISMIQLHRLTGISRSYLTELEQGKYDPKLSKVCIIAKALGCTLNELVDCKKV